MTNGYWFRYLFPDNTHHTLSLILSTTPRPYGEPFTTDNETIFTKKWWTTCTPSIFTIWQHGKLVRPNRSHHRGHVMSRHSLNKARLWEDLLTYEISPSSSLFCWSRSGFPRAKMCPLLRRAIFPRPGGSEGPGRNQFFCLTPLLPRLSKYWLDAMTFLHAIPLVFVPSSCRCRHLDSQQ